MPTSGTAGSSYGTSRIRFSRNHHTVFRNGFISAQGFLFLYTPANILFSVRILCFNSCHSNGCEVAYHCDLRKASVVSRAAARPSKSRLGVSAGLGDVEVVTAAE